MSERPASPLQSPTWREARLAYEAAIMVVFRLIMTAIGVFTFRSKD